MARFELRAPHELARFIAAKGSVALDGASLTVNTVAGRHVFRADHSAHVTVTTSARSRPAKTSTSRSTYGALRRAADRAEVHAALGLARARALERGLQLSRTWPTGPMVEMATRDAAAKDRPTRGARILVVEARFYDDIADALLAGAAPRWRRPARPSTS